MTVELTLSEQIETLDQAIRATELDITAKQSRIDKLDRSISKEMVKVEACQKDEITYSGTYYKEAQRELSEVQGQLDQAQQELKAFRAYRDQLRQLQKNQDALDQTEGKD